MKKNIEEARAYFARVGVELIGHFARLGSRCIEIDTIERLRIFYYFYHNGEENEYKFSLFEAMKKGHSFKD